jgi:hypothetical protein
MQIATFTLLDAEPQIFEVRWTWWGREEYLYDGSLLQRLWNLTTLSGGRSFQINGHAVRISWNAQEKFQTKVYVDGHIRVEDLFPSPTIRHAPTNWKKFLERTVIWAVIGYVGIWLYKVGVGW